MNYREQIFSQSKCIHCGGSHPTKKITQQIKGKGNKKSSSYLNLRNSKINILNVTMERRGQLQDFTYNIILWYVLKNIYLL